MTIRNWVIAGITAMGLLMPSAAVMAQEQAAAATPPDRRPEDNWRKICEPLATGEKACIMQQIRLNSVNQFMGSFVLRDDPGQESRLLAVAAVPLGMLLPFGLTWQIDGGQPVRVPFMLCDPQSCSTQLVINEAYVSSLKRGARLTLTAKNRQNQDYVVEINLGGFTSVYESEASLTFDEFNQQSTGASALERVLQDRAEELRRQMDVDAEAASAAEETAPAQ